MSDLICEKKDGIAHRIGLIDEIVEPEDAREGPRAFREKRDPVFTGA